MSLVAKRFEPRAEHLKLRLQHWFKFDHLKPSQGISILIGVEPGTMEYANQEVVDLVHLANLRDPDYLADVGGSGASLVAFPGTSANRILVHHGVDLLNGDRIGGNIFEQGEPSLYETFISEELEQYLDEAMDRFYPYVRQYDDLLQYWKSGQHPKCTPPSYFVEWSLSKGFQPAWLNQAIDFGICSPKQKSNDPRQNDAVFKFDAGRANFPPELAIALRAWQEVSVIDAKGKPKARIRAWLDKNTSLSNEAKERIATVANWDKTGGATRTD